MRKFELLYGLLFFILLTTCTYAVNLSECQEINVSDTYVLNSSIEINDSTCMNVFADNVVIDCAGLSIVGNNFGGSSAVFTNSTNTTVRNCTIISFIYGVEYYTASGGLVEYNNITSTYNVSAGVYLHDGSNDTVIHSNIVDTTNDDNDTSLEFLAKGIHINISNNNTVLNNYVITNGTEANAIELQMSSNSVINYNALQTGDINSYGIFVWTLSGNINASYNNITTYGNAAFGIYMFDAVNNMTIDSNRIITNQDQAIGIYAYNIFQNSTLQNNDISTVGTNSHAISLDTYGDVNQIMNNVMSTTNVGSVGVDMFASSYNNISMNNITTTAGSGKGIYIDLSLNNSVTYNNITTSGDASYAINCITNTNFTFIANNIIYTNGINGYGIHFQSNAGSSNITGNLIITSSEDSPAIFLEISSADIIEYNIMHVSFNYSTGIKIADADNITMNNNDINTTGDDGPAIYLYSNTMNSNISFNTMRTFGNRSNGIFLDSDLGNNSLVSNTIVASGDNSTGIMLQSSSNNNITLNDIKTTRMDSEGIGLLLASHNNAITNNTMNVSHIRSSHLFLEYSDNNSVYYNYLKGRGYWVNDTGYMNNFSTTVDDGITNISQGNTYYFLYQFNVSDEDNNDWGDSGEDYPLSSDTVPTKWLSNASSADYGPYMLPPPSVSSGGSSSGGGGHSSGSSGSRSVSNTQEIFYKGTWHGVTKGSTSMNIDREGIPIVIVFAVHSFNDPRPRTLNINATDINPLNMSIGQEVYKYVIVNYTVYDQDYIDLEALVRVEKEWVQNQSINPLNVSIYELNAEGGWQVLTEHFMQHAFKAQHRHFFEYEYEDAKYYYYELSLVPNTAFAIGLPPAAIDHSVHEGHSGNEITGGAVSDTAEKSVQENLLDKASLNIREINFDGVKNYFRDNGKNIFNISGIVILVLIGLVLLNYARKVEWGNMAASASAKINTSIRSVNRRIRERRLEAEKQKMSEHQVRQRQLHQEQKNQQKEFYQMQQEHMRQRQLHEAPKPESIYDEMPHYTPQYNTGRQKEQHIDSKNPKEMHAAKTRGAQLALNEIDRLLMTAEKRLWKNDMEGAKQHYLSARTLYENSSMTYKQKMTVHPKMVEMHYKIYKF